MNPPRPQILYVEDNQVVAAVMQTQLRRGGVDVTVTRAGEIALLLAARQHFDLLLLDLGLPGMDGMEVCARLKANPTLARIPVIMFTGRELPLDREQAERLGVIAFLTKSDDVRAAAGRILQELYRLHYGVELPPDETTASVAPMPPSS